MALESWVLSLHSPELIDFPQLQDIIAIGIAAGGYFCGALPLAVYAGQWDDFNGLNVRSEPVASSASATSVSSIMKEIATSAEPMITFSHGLTKVRLSLT